jgi:hypothetical protein
MQYKWRRLQAASLFFFIIVLCYGYQGIVVRNMTRPLEETHLDTLQELRDGGYKFVVGSEAEARYMMYRFNQARAKQIGVPPSTLDRFIINPAFRSKTPAFFEILAASRGFALVGPGSGNTLVMKEYHVGRFHYKVGNVSCALLSQSPGQTKMYWFLSLHYSTQALRLLQLIKSSGIYNHLGGSVVESRRYVIMGLYGPPMDTHSPRPLSLGSSLRILFLQYTILNCISVLVFCLESHVRIWMLLVKGSLLLKALLHLQGRAWN